MPGILSIKIMLDIYATAGYNVSKEINRLCQTISKKVFIGTRKVAAGLLTMRR
jgi:hypothetical protein